MSSNIELLYRYLRSLWSSISPVVAIEHATDGLWALWLAAELSHVHLLLLHDDVTA
jgi:hypothetical protein